MERNTQKTHITLSIPKRLYEEMKKFKEIKWSEIARKSIEAKVRELKERESGMEILKRISPEARAILEKIPEKEWKKAYKEMRRKEWERTRSLMQTS